MASSRSSAPPIHPSRRKQVQNNNSTTTTTTTTATESSPHPAFPNHRRSNDRRKHSRAPATTHPIGKLKSHARSLRRLLDSDRANLPATVRVEKERELGSVAAELARNLRAKRRNEVIGRWHKVRFFDRQKAAKRLKKARRLAEAAAASGKEEAEGPRQAALDAEVDVNYALYYPLERDYVSLFPRRKEGEEEEEGGGLERKGDPEMWALVKKCMADGTLEALRNGSLTAEGGMEDSQRSEGGGDDEKKKRKGRKERSDVKVGKNRSESVRAGRERNHEYHHDDNDDDDDDDSDGGFFA